MLVPSQLMDTWIVSTLGFREHSCASFPPEHNVFSPRGHVSKRNCWVAWQLGIPSSEERSDGFLKGLHQLISTGDLV